MSRRRDRGLTLALALRRRGMEAEAFEQAAEIGAAMALSANATRELRRRGLLDAVMAASTEPIELIWRGGRGIAAHPVHHGLRYQERFGAPCCGTHRADLQRAPSGALGGAGLHLGHRLAAIEDRGGDVNHFAAAEGPTVWPREGGSTAEIQQGKALTAFEGWHPAVTEMLAATEHTMRWGCSWRPACCGGAAAGRSCWATPRTRRRRITARARTPRSRMPSP